MFGHNIGSFATIGDNTCDAISVPQVESQGIDIVDREVAKKEFVVINDDEFINDKLDQLGNIKKHVTSLLGILEENPSGRDLQQGIIDTMMSEVNSIHESIGRIMRDDDALKQIYDALKDL